MPSDLGPLGTVGAAALVVIWAYWFVLSVVVLWLMVLADDPEGVAGAFGSAVELAPHAIVGAMVLLLVGGLSAPFDIWREIRGASEDSHAE